MKNKNEETHGIWIHGSKIGIRHRRRVKRSRWRRVNLKKATEDKGTRRDRRVRNHMKKEKKHIKYGTHRRPRITQASLSLSLSLFLF